MAKRSKPSSRPAKTAAATTPAAATAPVSAGDGTSNHLTDAILAGTDDAVKVARLKATHPLYEERHDGWRKLIDAFEGSGGFADGEYLWRYPNEKPDEFTARKKMARYHNFARGLVNIYVRHVFREGVKRESANPDLQAWFQNVDGARTPMSEFMKRVARLMLVAGHSGILVDKTTDVPVGPSLADDAADIIASVFPATAILDWRERDGELVAVKLTECAPAPAITEPMPTGDEATQYLLFDKAGWARFDAEAGVVRASNWATPMGMLPFIVGRPEPSAEYPFLGLSLLGDPNVYGALYNRCSEQDEVARAQAFSVLVVSVPAGDNVSADAVANAKTQLGTDIGTTRAIVVQGEVDYKTADMGVLEAIGQLIDFLIREMYRAAHIRFASGSLDAESADAIRLQSSELNEMLANLAAECQRIEREMARAWCFWKYPAAQAEQAFEDATVTIVYPREFFIADLLEELQKWGNAIKLDLGKAFEEYAKKRVVDQLAPDLDEATKQQIYDEIAAMEQNRDKAIAEQQARFGVGVARIAGVKPPEPPKPGEVDPKAAAA